MTVTAAFGRWEVFNCHLCWRIAMAVLLAIVVIEAIILVPSYRNYERDLLTRLEETGEATVTAGLSLFSHFGNRDLLELGAALADNSLLKGGAMYGTDGAAMGTFGEPPELTLGQARRRQFSPVRTKDGNRYEVVWPMDTGARPYTLIGRLDSSWIQPELNAFVLRIVGLVFVISLFVTGGTMLVLNRMLFSPLLALRQRMLATTQDTEHPIRYAIESKRDDELGDVIAAFNSLLNRLSGNIKRIGQQKKYLLDAKEMAEISNHAKSAFLTRMSHELRTPMNAILGYGQFLESNPNDPLTPSQKEHVQQILRGGNHLLELINEILDLASIEAGKINLSISEVSPALVIDECLTLIQPVADEYGITVENKVNGEPLPEVRADHTRFVQVLLNLITNAIKYNRDNGTVIVDGRLSSKGLLRISVTDTGNGIPEDKLKDLFEPFNRLGAEATNIEGTGVGLTITRQLVELMNGAMGVDSVVGTGSTFWFDLPVTSGAASPKSILSGGEPILFQA